MMGASMLHHRLARAGLALLVAGALASCGAVFAPGPAGSEVDEGNFGNPTMNNIQVQSGGQQSVILNLSSRFSSEVDPSVTFAFNSAALDGTAQTILRRQATWIRQFPEVRFKVFGHTDAVGSNAYNKRLGLRRAQTVVNYLVSRGVSRSRLQAVVSFGESQPLIVTQGRERRNRRTVTEVTGFVKNHPMLLNGKYAEVIFREYVASAAPAGGEASAGAGGGSGAGGGAAAGGGAGGNP